MTLSSGHRNERLHLSDAFCENDIGRRLTLVSTDLLRKLLRCYLSSSSSSKVRGSSSSNALKGGIRKEMRNDSSKSNSCSSASGGSSSSSDSTTKDRRSDAGSTHASNAERSTTSRTAGSCSGSSTGVLCSSRCREDVSSSICYDLMFESTSELQALAKQQQEAAASCRCCCSCPPCSSDRHHAASCLFSAGHNSVTAAPPSTAACNRSADPAAALAASAAVASAAAAPAAAAAVTSEVRGGPAGAVSHNSMSFHAGEAVPVETHGGSLGFTSAAHGLAAAAATARGGYAARAGDCEVLRTSAAAPDTSEASQQQTGTDEEASHITGPWHGLKVSEPASAGDACSSRDSSSRGENRHEGGETRNRSSNRGGAADGSSSSSRTPACAEADISNCDSRRGCSEEEASSRRYLERLDLYRKDFLASAGRDTREWFPARCYSCGEVFPCCAVVGLLQQALLLQHTVLEPLLHALMQTPQQQEQQQQQRQEQQPPEERQQHQKQQQQREIPGTQVTLDGGCCSSSYLRESNHPERRKIIIVEGVHITPAFMRRICRRYGSRCLAFVLYVHSKEEHAARLRTRPDEKSGVQSSSARHRSGNSTDSSSGSRGSSSAAANSSTGRRSQGTKQRPGEEQHFYPCNPRSSASACDRAFHSRLSAEKFPVHAGELAAAGGKASGEEATYLLRGTAFTAALENTEGRSCVDEDGEAAATASITTTTPAADASARATGAREKQQLLQQQHEPEGQREERCPQQPKRQQPQQLRRREQEQEQYAAEASRQQQVKQQQEHPHGEQQAEQEKLEQEPQPQHDDNKYTRHLINIRCMQLYMCCATQRLAYEGREVSSAEKKTLVAAACARFASEAAAPAGDECGGPECVVAAKGGSGAAAAGRRACGAAPASAAGSAVPAAAVDCEGNNGVYTLHSRDLRCSLDAIGRVLLSHHPRMFR